MGSQPVQEGSGVHDFDPASLRGESFGSATRPTVPCGSHGSGVKKDLVDLAMGLVSRVLKAHSCIFKAPTSEQLWSTRRADRQHH
jgi:hypothetical protein